MSGHRKYDHVERLDHPDVDGLYCGTCYVFPKLDGANASIWIDAESRIHCGSRNQTLDEERALMGFYNWVSQRRPLFEDAYRHSIPESWRLYGEWLVPHTLMTYREEAWKKFYVIDVFDHEKGKYVHYDQYSPALQRLAIPVVEPLCIIKNPTEEQLHKQVLSNTYLINDNAGLGEGIVVKNYDWTNAWGRQPWAKIVRTEFKEENRRAFGVTEKEGAFQVECAIAEEFVTPHLVSKTRAKIENQILDGLDPSWTRNTLAAKRGELIPRLLQTVFTDLVIEESYHFVKKHKNPTIDFKKLQQFTTLQVKKYAADLF